MSLPRSCVQFVGDVIALRLGRSTQAFSLRQVLPNEPIEVLVTASFPGMVGRGEVAGNREALLEHGEVVELGAVVEGDGLEVSCVLADRLQRRPRHLGLGTGLELFDDRQAALALDQGQQAMAHVLAHDRVAFPVAQFAASLDLGRAFGDMPLARHQPARGRAAISLAALLGHDAGELEQSAAGALVAADVAVDRLVAGHRRAFGA